MEEYRERVIELLKREFDGQHERVDRAATEGWFNDYITAMHRAGRSVDWTTRELADELAYG